MEGDESKPKEHEDVKGKAHLVGTLAAELCISAVESANVVVDNAIRGSHPPPGGVVAVLMPGIGQWAVQEANLELNDQRKTWAEARLEDIRNSLKRSGLCPHLGGPEFPYPMDHGCQECVHEASEETARATEAVQTALRSGASNITIPAQVTIDPGQNKT